MLAGMPVERLVRILSVTLAGGASTTVAHGIKNGNGQDRAPNLVLPDRVTPLRVTAVTNTQVTFNNPTADPAARTAIFFAELEHAFQRDPLRDVLAVSYWQGDGGGIGSQGDLQDAYDAGGPGPQVIEEDSTNLGISVRDAAVPINGALFDVSNNAGTTQYAEVNTDGISTDVALTLVNSAAAVSPGGTCRIRSNGGVLQVSQNGAAYVSIAGTTLQGAYTAGGAGPQIIAESAAGLGILIRDAASTVGTIFAVQDSGGGSTWFGSTDDGIAVSQAAQAGGPGPVLLAATIAAHTALQASTEWIPVNINLGATVQWATGALTTERFFRIQRPTIAFVAASVITNAYTLYVDGPPLAGTNASYALGSGAHAAFFGGQVRIQGTQTPLLWLDDQTGTVDPRIHFTNQNVGPLITDGAFINLDLASLNIRTVEAITINLGTNNLNRWSVLITGELLAAADNQYDIGANAAGRPKDLFLAGRINWPTGNTQTTVGAAGGASALPVLPTGYARIKVNNSDAFVIPYYAQA